MTVSQGSVRNKAVASYTSCELSQHQCREVIRAVNIILPCREQRLYHIRVRVVVRLFVRCDDAEPRLIYDHGHIPNEVLSLPYRLNFSMNSALWF